MAELPEKGISIWVVAAICGNWWQESGINPGIWESLTPVAWTDTWYNNTGGYGLGQWTNVGSSHGRLYQLHTYLVDNGYEDDSGDGEIGFLLEEDYWIPGTGYANQYKSLQEFLESDSTDLTDLVHCYNDAWEGIHDSSWNDRVGYAQKCFDFIRDHHDDLDITEWITGNRYLPEAERLNNAVMAFRALNGELTPGKRKDEEIIAVLLHLKRRRNNDRRTLLL